MISVYSFGPIQLTNRAGDNLLTFNCPICNTYIETFKVKVYIVIKSEQKAYDDYKRLIVCSNECANMAVLQII